MQVSKIVIYIESHDHLCDLYRQSWLPPGAGPDEKNDINTGSCHTCDFNILSSNGTV